ncbi:hypothetical protein [Actinacidiphila oryziradicis]|nr:hypothetical protein [Actinacidiphila oryziradicis]
MAAWAASAVAPAWVAVSAAWAQAADAHTRAGAPGKAAARSHLP